ncbi:MAG TPA: sugar transferase, partial [Burkholderiaceae bacterium]|nr:sugar transferase [Burkholderiaceae bacterium]
MAKRLFDILASGLGLLLLSPLLLGVALWIKWDSPGPVMFRQERVGRFGRPFFIHKFRSMRVDAPALGPQITIGEDPRITRSGRFLRRSKIDELPQLWDVLRGAMSLVGPRPEVPRYVALYPAELRDIVLSVRPGITDPASLAFADESAMLAQARDPERAYVEEILPEKLAVSARYLQQAGL